MTKATWRAEFFDNSADTSPSRAILITADSEEEASKLAHAQMEGAMRVEVTLVPTMRNRLVCALRAADSAIASPTFSQAESAMNWAITVVMDLRLVVAELKTQQSQRVLLQPHVEKLERFIEDLKQVLERWGAGVRPSDGNALREVADLRAEEEDLSNLLDEVQRSPY
jgi:hypothetical protein